MKRFLLLVIVCAFSSPVFAQQSVVAKYRSKYSTPLTPNTAVALLKEVAGEVHGGLLVKRDGNNCNGYACDIICFSDNNLYDVLADADGAAIPSWNPTTNPRGYSCELVKVEEQPQPEEEPKVEPQPVPDNNEIIALLKQIAEDNHAIRLLLEKTAARFGIR